MSTIMRHSDISLSEHLRPQQLRDLTLPEQAIERLQRLLDRQAPMNLLFYGKPGLGKTSAARIFTKARDCNNEEIYDSIEINGSLQTGIDSVRTIIDGFASTVSLFGRFKICFIDEADYLSSNAQASLRGVIERFSHNTRFIMTVNDLNKISAALQSRMICIPFDINASNRTATIARMTNRYAERLGELDVSFDRVRLNQIVSNYFPDFRQIASRLEFELC
jgi:replication factor C small subunit